MAIEGVLLRVGFCVCVIGWVVALFLRPIHKRRILKREGDSYDLAVKAKEVSGNYIFALVVTPIFLLLGTSLFRAFVEEDQAEFIHYDILQGQSFDYLTRLDIDAEGGLFDLDSLNNGYLFEIEDERVAVLISSVKQKDGRYHYEVYQESDKDYPAMLVKKEFDKRNQRFY